MTFFSPLPFWREPLALSPEPVPAAEMASPRLSSGSHLGSETRNTTRAAEATTPLPQGARGASSPWGRCWLAQGDQSRNPPEPPGRADPSCVGHRGHSVTGNSHLQRFLGCQPYTRVADWSVTGNSEPDRLCRTACRSPQGSFALCHAGRIGTDCSPNKSRVILYN